MAASTNYDHVVVVNNSQQQGSTTVLPTSTARVFGAASTAPGANTRYLSAPGTTTPASAQVVLGLATNACTMQSLRASVGTAPGGSDTVIFNVMTSVDDGATWVASTLTCTVTGTATNAADTAHQVSLAAGTLLAIRIISSAGTAAAITASFEVG